MTGEELLEIIEPEWIRMAPGVARKLTKPKNRAKVIALLDSFLRRREAMLAEEDGDEPAPKPEPEPTLRDEVRAAMYRFLEAQVDGGATGREVVRELLPRFKLPASTLREWIDSDPYLQLSMRDGLLRLRPPSPTGGPPPRWAAHELLIVKKGDAPIQVWRCEWCAAWVPAEQAPEDVRHGYGCPHGPVQFPKSKLNEIQRLLMTLNRKAAKLGVGGGLALRVVREFPRKVHVGEHNSEEARDRCSAEVFPEHWPDIPHVEITVEGSVPKLPGFRVLGVLQHPDAGDADPDGPARNIVRDVPGRDVPARYRRAPPNCDHCKLPRRRKETVVLENAEGEALQIGRSCLALYTGSSDAEERIRAFLNFQEFWAQVRAASEGAEILPGDEDDEGAGVPVRVPAVLALADFMAWVIGCVREEGFVSKAMVGRPGGPGYTTGECGLETGLSARKEGKRPPPEDLAEAEAVLAWARAHITDETAKTSFEHNMATVLARDYVDSDTQRYAPWILKKYRDSKSPRVLVDEYRPEPEGPAPVTMKLTVTFKKPIQGYYGWQDLYLFTDEVGRTVKLYHRADGKGPDVGDTVEVVAEIRRKDAYKGKKQTLVKKLDRLWVRAEPSEVPERVELRARARALLERGGPRGVRELVRAALESNADDLAEVVAVAERKLVEAAERKRRKAAAA